MDEPTAQNKKAKIESPPPDLLMRQLVTCQRFALLGRLSPAITHEINNHLTGVNGYAQLLLANDKAAGLERELDKIATSAGRCRSLIEKMREVARFENGESEFNNINLIIGSTLDLMRRLFEKKSLQLIEHLSEEVRSSRVDTPALGQVFLNIIQNSFEALTEKGTKLTVSTLMEGEAIVVTFVDDGPGLSEEALAHLFVPFFTTKAEIRCPGLGLSASKIVVEDHGGSIAVANSPHGGASVRIMLPAGSNGG